MTQSGEKETDDQGFVFFLVKCSVPKLRDTSGLSRAEREKLARNFECAQQYFRSTTLLLPGSDARLFVGNPFDVVHFSEQVDRLLLNGIENQEIKNLCLVPDEGGASHLPSVQLVFAKEGDYQYPSFVTAKKLLGDYWYRHREMNVLDTVQLAEDIRKARESGASSLDIIRRTKPPAPSRRLE